ncbi:MAG: hypothetical protein EXX96DRAFT_187125 [Benjaminiella poitrasii]|nr:MAG: hypothetical protein EXX96DRAFT_187125 [Benjaminiella poitrasii]
MTTYHSVATDEPPRSLSITVNSAELTTTTTTRKRESRSILATVMLTICIITFILQTELAQYVQKTTSYSKPYFILYISHSCYVFMIPLQFIGEYLYQRCYATTERSSLLGTLQRYKTSFSNSLSDLLRHQGMNNDQPPHLFILKMSLTLSVLLTLPSYVWYLSVNLTSMSNLTAIYNTGCFFAYLFSILMLQDRIVPAKLGAVMLCMVGVVTMAFWSSSPTDNGQLLLEEEKKSVLKEGVGIAVASLGAALYGFYEVYYKKYASPPLKSTILFANTITGIIGIVTFCVLWVPFPILHVTGLERFEWPESRTLGYILAIASMSVIYNATFMAVIALINPVFAAVGVMLTIPAVAITDVFVTGVMVPLSTVIGSLFILIGFIILNRQVIQEENEKDSSDNLYVQD